MASPDPAAACTCGKGDDKPAICHADTCPCVDWVAGPLEGPSAAAAYRCEHGFANAEGCEECAAWADGWHADHERLAPLAKADGGTPPRAESDKLGSYLAARCECIGHDCTHPHAGGVCPDCGDATKQPVDELKHRRSAASAHELLAETSPRPWYIVGPPWNDGDPYIVSGSADPHAGSFVCDLCPLDDPQPGRNEWADGELIVWLANRAEAVLDLEKAVRELLRRTQITDPFDSRHAIIDVIHDALARIDGRKASPQVPPQSHERSTT